MTSAEEKKTWKKTQRKFRGFWLDNSLMSSNTASSMFSHYKEQVAHQFGTRHKLSTKFVGLPKETGANRRSLLVLFIMKEQVFSTHFNIPFQTDCFDIRACLS